MFFIKYCLQFTSCLRKSHKYFENFFVIIFSGHFPSCSFKRFWLSTSSSIPCFTSVWNHHFNISHSLLMSSDSRESENGDRMHVILKGEPLWQGHTRQTVVCHHAYVCLSRLMVICQSRPHYISENQTSAFKPQCKQSIKICFRPR